VVAAAALSRAAPVAMAWRLPYAGGGTGTWTTHIGSAPVILASVVALALAISNAGISTIGMVAAVAICATLVGWWSTRRLGGITGDGFGAAIELGETLAIAVAVAVR
jgi:adenosylcobinamide-GDP ribazoletransferase